MAFIKGTLKGFQFYRNNRKGAIEWLMKEQRLDRGLAEDVYKFHQSIISENGTKDAKWQRAAIEHVKRSLKVTEDIPLNQVFDFSYARKALK